MKILIGILSITSSSIFEAQRAWVKLWLFALGHENYCHAKLLHLNLPSSSSLRISELLPRKDLSATTAELKGGRYWCLHYVSAGGLDTSQEFCGRLLKMAYTPPSGLLYTDPGDLLVLNLFASMQHSLHVFFVLIKAAVLPLKSLGELYPSLQKRIPGEPSPYGEIPFTTLIPSLFLGLSLLIEKTGTARKEETLGRIFQGCFLSSSKSL